MNTMKKEMWIALGVAILMITILGIFFFISKHENKNTLSYKVYKLYTKEDNEEEHYYKECQTSYEDLITIHTPFKKILSLPKSSIITGIGINGNYKIVNDTGEYIAFDDSESNQVYIGKQNKIYSYQTTLYENIIKLCGD